MLATFFFFAAAFMPPSAFMPSPRLESSLTHSSRRSALLTTMGSSSRSSSKPKRRVAESQQQLPSSSHKKTANKWRHEGAQTVYESREKGIAVKLHREPTMQSDKLPPPREGERVPVGRYPALVLNADYTPLSYVPLSLWSWQDTVRAVYRGAVTVLSTYDIDIRSPSTSMALPSVIVLNKYVGRTGRGKPCFTRRNVFLRDRFTCQYCNTRLAMKELTYDHVVPRACGGATSWENIVTACSKCNLRKGSRELCHCPDDLRLRTKPQQPTWGQLQQNARHFPPRDMHPDWEDYLFLP
jgi:5-methylcytosine-specific restriction endonuclease McrA